MLGDGGGDFVVDKSWNKLPQQLFGLEGIWLQSRVVFVHVCVCSNLCQCLLVVFVETTHQRISRWVFFCGLAILPRELDDQCCHLLTGQIAK